MSNPYFSFKQFTVCHDQCAMKAGTDGVLLGAWADAGRGDRILDVGTGCGLVALQLAQRYLRAKVTAVEVNPEAARQAAENVGRSPWAQRVEVACCDFRHFSCTCRFDLVACNPPYFVDALKCPGKQRSTARHAGSLNYESLMAGSARLLAPDGQVAVIVPAGMKKPVTDAAWRNRLFPRRRTDVYTKPGKPCRRILFSFGFAETACLHDELHITSALGEYTPQYVALTRAFYLNMP